MNFNVNINPGDLIEITRPNPNKWTQGTEIDIFNFLVISIGEPEFVRFNYSSNFDDDLSFVSVNIPINLSTVKLPRSVLYEDEYTINISFSIKYNKITSLISLELTQDKSDGFSVIYDEIDESIHASINGSKINLHKLVSIRS